MIAPTSAITSSTPLAGDTEPVGANQKAFDAVAAGSLYGESFCASCHAVQNAAGNVVGGDLGPELTRVGSKVKPEWLQAWLKNPRVYDGATAMPHYRFNDQQLATLAGYFLLLISLPALLALFPFPAVRSTVPAGGIVGSLISSELLEGFNFWGALLVAVALFFTSLFMTTRFSFAGTHAWAPRDGNYTPGFVVG